MAQEKFDTLTIVCETVKFVLKRELLVTFETEALPLTVVSRKKIC